MSCGKGIPYARSVTTSSEPIIPADPQRIRERFSTGLSDDTRRGASRLWLPSVDSTQRFLMREAKEHPEFWPHASGVGANYQTAGHGRRGNAWQAAPGASVSMSILLKPARLGPGLQAQYWPWITLVAAATLVDWFGELGVTAQVKWPNDVLGSDGRKLVGILAQVVDEDRVILGLGINRDFGGSGQQRPVDTAAALSDYNPVLATVGSRKLADEAMTRLVAGLETFAERVNPPNPDRVEDELRRLSRLIVTEGQYISGELPGQRRLTGWIRGLGDTGSLLVEPDPSLPEDTLEDLPRDPDTGWVDLTSAVIHHVRPR